GDEVYLVGGSVRDALLGRETGDVDIATSGRVEESGSALARLFAGTFVVMDAERGIGRVIVSGQAGIQHIDIVSLGESIESNLARRDFTIDAMAVPLRIDGEHTAEIVDLFEGQIDLDAGRIRALNDAVFTEDPVRLLRAVRLAAQLDMQIESGTTGAIKRDVALVVGIAGERVRDELLKLLATARPSSALKLLDELGLLCEIMPELLESKGVDQPAEHHWDVFNHLVESPGQVERVLSVADEPQDEAAVSVPTFDGIREYFAAPASDGFSRRTMLKFAALLHDVGKPATKTIEDNGRIRFLGHQHVGAETVEEITKRLRFSRKGVEMVSSMVTYHLRPSQMAQPGEMPTARAAYRYFRDVGDVAIDTVYLNMADYLAAKGPELEIEDWQRHCRIIETILESRNNTSSEKESPKLLNGYTLMKAFDIPAGRFLGQMLELVREAQMTGEIHTVEEALELVKAKMEERNGGA
ncbi:MAG: HD domain-containing protein, partial [Chloroflexi bacterium]|nr:HD domain-containing protein [Chloroflexota bacterium]